MESVKDRFLRYVAIDTASEVGVEAYPSTEKQKDLGRLILKELQELGVESSMDQYGYVYASIPSNQEDEDIPAIAFLAHFDTSPDFSGKDVKPRIVENYDGGIITLNEDKRIYLDPKEYPHMLSYLGKDLIVTDGTTLLGADDKAGIAEIMTMVEYILNHPEIPHGDIKLGFTVDEEIGRGVEYFDVKKLGADFGYTVDGGIPAELSYENFNAASASITIQGRNIHPGVAKNMMKNSLLIAMELQSMLPVFENPMYTEDYEGFFHLNDMSGSVEESKMLYIIRDHDRDLFESKKVRMKKIVDYLNDRYGEGTVILDMKDSYYNMKEKIDENYAVVTIIEKAMEEMGITPIAKPIRGGTDGSNLSFMGLPCPNIGTGGHNAHGKHEYVCIQSMEQMVEMLVKMASIVARKKENE